MHYELILINTIRYWLREHLPMKALLKPVPSAVGLSALKLKSMVLFFSQIQAQESLNFFLPFSSRGPRSCSWRAA